jgi:hypothetical protein
VFGGYWFYWAGDPTTVYDSGTALFEVIGTGPSVTFNCNVGLVVVGTGPEDATLKYTMDAGGVSPIEVNGSVTLTDSPHLVLDFSTVPAVGDITLIDNDGSDLISGTFDSAPEGTTYGPGDAWTLTYVGGDGNDLVLEGGMVGQPGTLIYGK